MHDISAASIGFYLQLTADSGLVPALMGVVAVADPLGHGLYFSAVGRYPHSRELSHHELGLLK